MLKIAGSLSLFILIFFTKIQIVHSIILDEPSVPQEQVPMADPSYLVDHNATNINVSPQDKTTLERLHNWLKPTHYTGEGSELEKHISSHLEGTSQWLIDSSVFQQWHGGNDHGILWIRGVPGTGKSVLAAKLVAHLASEDRPVLHFFFRHTIQSNHRPESALRDWLAQILPFSPELQLALKDLAFGDKGPETASDIPMAELWDLLQLALRSIPRAYVVVDALDEMDHEVMEQFLHLLDQLGNLHPERVKLIITSRPIATIEKIVRNLRLLDIRLSNDLIAPDIKMYLRHRLDQISMASESREAIVAELLEKADGLFLYAKLAMDTIRGLETPNYETVTETLAKTPVDLSAIYSNILREHMARMELPEGFSILVLQLVTHAIRPLRLLEIADLIKATKPEYSHDIGALKNHVRTSCGPLLEIIPDETVRVVHHSLTEYLFGLNRSLSDHDIPVFQSGPVHNVLAQLCLSYLQAGCLDTVEFVETMPDKTSRETLTHVKNPEVSPFMYYAATNWPLHMTKSFSQGFPQEEANRKLFSIFTTPEYATRLALIMSRDNPHDRPYNQVFWERVSRDQKMALEAKALLSAIHLDLLSFAEHLLSLPDSRVVAFTGTLDLQPPLHKAIMKGNLDMVRLLTSKGANISHYNNRGESPLHMAVGSKDGEMRIRPTIVKHLLECGANPWQKLGKDEEHDFEPHHFFEFREKNGETVCFTDFILPPVQLAFNHGDEEVAKLFLPYIKSEKQAKSALHWALDEGKDPGVLKLIIDLGLLDVNAPIMGSTPLFDACIRYNPKAVAVLLEAGADPNIGKEDLWIDDMQIRGGENVLHGLAAPGYYRQISRNEPNREDEMETCFALVLAAGANVNHTNDDGITPLHLAMTPRAAKILLDAGANPLAMNKDGLTPLHVADNLDVMKVLLTKTDINARSHKGRTVLLETSSKDYLDYGSRRQELSRKTALDLLDLGADPNVTDNDGDGILHYLFETGAIGKSDADILLERLLKAGMDVNLRNNKGQTALHKLEAYTLEKVTAQLKPLLERADVDVNALDDEGNTFLFNLIEGTHTWFASPEEDDEFIAMMVKAGARFDITDAKGRTLLHAFMHHCRSGEERMLKLLIEKGVDPTQTDKQGNTLWHEGAARFWSDAVSPKLFSAITAMGVDPRKRNSRGRSMLHVILEREYLDSTKPSLGRSDNEHLFKYILDQSLEDINKPDNDGITPLHIASTFSTDLTRRLLDVGADVTLATHEGLNAFHIASRCRQSNTIGLLINLFKTDGLELTSFENKKMAKLVEPLNAVDKRGWTPLFYACASGRYQSVELLLRTTIAFIQADEFPGTALDGCMEFEDELKNWHRDTAQPAVEPGTSAVYIDGTARPIRRESDKHEGSYQMGQIDESLDLLVNTATLFSSELGPDSIAKGIVIAANRQLDYTVESLQRVRKSKSEGFLPPSTDEVQQCLKRRKALVAEVEKKRKDGLSFSKQIEFMVDQKLYQAIPSYVSEYSPRPESKELIGVLSELARCGYLMVLDKLLRTNVVSDLWYDLDALKDGKVERSSNDISTLLVSACMSEQPNMHVVELLLRKRATPDKIVLIANGKGQVTALHAIVRPVRNHWWQTAQALPYLLEKTTDLEVRDHDGRTPLSLSLEHSKEPWWTSRATAILLEAGANPSSVDDQGKSCLDHAISNHHAFKLLLRYGAEPGSETLGHVIMNRDAELLESMLDSGANPSIRNVGASKYSYIGLYPLDLVITGWGDRYDAVRQRMIELLLNHGADLNLCYLETTVAHRILERRSGPGDWTHNTRNYYADAIIKHPLLNVDLKDAAGTPLLHAAYKAGDLVSARALIERGADIYATDSFNKTILHQSPDFYDLDDKTRNHMDFIKIVTARDPRILRRVDKDGRTPIHYAMCRNPPWEEIELMMNEGAKMYAKDVNGETGLHTLFKQEWNLIVDGDNKTYVDESIARLVDMFLNNGVDINARNAVGDPPVFGYFREGTLRATTRRGEELRKRKDVPREEMTTFEEEKNHVENMEKDISLEQEKALWTFFDLLRVEWTVLNDKRQSLLHLVAARRAEDKDSKTRKLRRFEFLLSKGLDPLGENIEHRTALDIAAANNAEEILALFKLE
ncbi:ankyrin repeat-containing domain [Fusarium longipes]|uniref:Ankyrin repeat-containing domain n=1 Tax=Fusarium longipes TaxID=694270 RepID=A0A395T3N9_9HYPO|nr:ankyrin repeat-containing domain [Fusarium longipes]